MKLLLDENLSPRLAPRLLSLFSELTHVREVGLRHADDRKIWNWAAINGYSIVTTDRDFVNMSQTLGWPPKIIHLEECTHPFRVIEDLLRRGAIRISEFEKDESTGVLSLRLRK